MIYGFCAYWIGGDINLYKLIHDCCHDDETGALAIMSPMMPRCVAGAVRNAYYTVVDVINRRPVRLGR